MFCWLYWWWTYRAVCRDIGGSDPERMAAPRVSDYVQEIFKNTCIKVVFIFALGRLPTNLLLFALLPPLPCVPQKSPPFLNNSVKNWPILIIYGILNPEKIWHEQLTDLSTSPVRCSHFTLGNPKKSFFSIIIHILQIIYVSSEENE